MWFSFVAGGDSCAEEGVLAAGEEAGALPGGAGDDDLRSLAGFEVGADHRDPVGAVGVEGDGKPARGDGSALR